MVVLLDAGHGKNTKGKRSPDGVFQEWEFNRDILRRVRERLESIGVVSFPVVYEDDDVSLTGRVSRVNEMCERIALDGCVLLSIHANAAGNGSRWMTASGWECYTTKGKTQSDALAECLYESFSEKFPDKRMRKDTTDGDCDKEAAFAMIQKTRCPAVLLENFFYDNREECEWLMMEKTRDQIAAAIVYGLMLYESKGL